jgi:hypothetical protein
MQDVEVGRRDGVGVHLMRRENQEEKKKRTSKKTFDGN